MRGIKGESSHRQFQAVAFKTFLGDVEHSASKQGVFNRLIGQRLKLRPQRRGQTLNPFAESGQLVGNVRPLAVNR